MLSENFVKQYMPSLNCPSRSVGRALDDLIDPATGKIPLDILWTANPISLMDNERGVVLYQALKYPDESEKPVFVPLAPGGKKTLSGIEYYDELKKKPSYPYGEDHLHMFDRYAGYIGSYLDEVNLFEACMGSGHLTAYGLRKMCERPHRIIAVDIDPINHRLYRAALERVPNPIKNTVDIVGDWLNPDTYKRKGIHTKGWEYFHGDVLQAARDDPRPTVILLLNTASNFPLDKQFSFIKDNFKPGTIALVTYCNAQYKPALEHIYSSPIISQLIVAGVNYKLWHSAHPDFDPRKIGGCVKVKKEGKETTVSFRVFEKDDPKNTMREFSPISRLSNLKFRDQVTDSGLKVLERFRIFPVRDRPTKYNNSLWVLQT